MVTLLGLVAADPLGGATVAERLAAVSFDGVPPKPTDLAHALIVLAERRALLGLIETAAGLITTGSKAPAAVAEMMMRECDRLLAAAQPQGQTYWSARDAMREALERIQRSDGADRVPTGIAALDKKTGGLHRRRAIYMAARPSMGKSGVAVAIAVNAAKAGFAVLYISLEMSLEQLEARIASMATYRGDRPIPYDRAVMGQLDQAEQECFVRAGMAYASLPIAIEERPGLSVAEIGSLVRKSSQELAGKGLRLGAVIVDHMGKVRSPD